MHLTSLYILLLLCFLDATNKRKSSKPARKCEKVAIHLILGKQELDFLCKKYDIRHVEKISCRLDFQSANKHEVHFHICNSYSSCHPFSCLCEYKYCSLFLGNSVKYFLNRFCGYSENSALLSSLKRQQ